MTQEQANIRNERNARISDQPVGSAVLIVNSYLGNPSEFLPMLNFVAGVRPNAVKAMARFICNVQDGFVPNPQGGAKEVCIDMLTDLYDGHKARIEG
jgi:hypothetical protein